MRIFFIFKETSNGLFPASIPKGSFLTGLRLLLLLLFLLIPFSHSTVVEIFSFSFTLTMIIEVDRTTQIKTRQMQLESR